MRIGLIGQISDIHTLRALCERCAALDVDQIFYIGGQPEIREQLPAARSEHPVGGEDIWTLASRCTDATIDEIRTVISTIRQRNALLALNAVDDEPALEFRSPKDLRFALCTALDDDRTPSSSNAIADSGVDSSAPPPDVVAIGDRDAWLAQERDGTVTLATGRGKEGGLLVIDDRAGLNVEAYDESGSYLALVELPLSQRVSVSSSAHVTTHVDAM